ncbi:MAG: M28 family peptidase [Thermoplasmatota archaeon]
MDRKLLFGIPITIAALILILALVIDAGSFIHSDNPIILIEFDHEAAGNHVRELVQWGPRMSGSEEERLGAEYILSQFQEAGLDEAYIETYSVPMFEVITAEVSLVPYMRPLYNLPNPLGSSIQFRHIEEFVMQGYSGSYGWNSFRDDLTVYNIGDGTDDSQYANTMGRVCFIEQTADTPSNSEVYVKAYEAGARAIILQNCWRGENIGYLPMFKTNQNPIHYEDYPDIPFFMVSKDMGDTIIENQPQHKLRLNIDVRIGNMDIRIVVGELTGNKHPDEYVYFTAHHDTCYNTIGAIDNTVGPAQIIEIARSMSKYDTDRTIRFLTVGGEEEGLYGSTAYYQAHRTEIEGNVRAVLNFDMAHTDTEAMSLAMVTNNNDTMKKLEDIGGRLLEKEPDLSKFKISYHYDELDIPYSDYYPFTSGGANGVAAWGSGCEEYHTYLDDLDHLNPESLQVEARILGSYALIIAG